MLSPGMRERVSCGFKFPTLFTTQLCLLPFVPDSPFNLQVYDTKSHHSFADISIDSSVSITNRLKVSKTEIRSIGVWMCLYAEPPICFAQLLLFKEGPQLLSSDSPTCGLYRESYS